MASLLLQIVFISNVYAKSYSTIVRKNINKEFDYKARNLQEYNGIQANRDCLRNYEMSTSVSNDITDKYTNKFVDSGTTFSAVPTEIFDVDYKNTNNTYLSKGLVVSAETTTKTDFYEKRYYTNPIPIDNLRVRFIVEIDDLKELFLIYQSDLTNDINNLYYYFDLNLKRVVFSQNNSGKIYNNDVFATKGTYEYLSIQADIFYSTCYFKIDCYNSSGYIVKSSTFNDDLTSYITDYDCIGVKTMYRITNQWDTFTILAEDSNYYYSLTDEYTYYPTKINDDLYDYSFEYATTSNNIHDFYLTDFSQDISIYKTSEYSSTTNFFNLHKMNTKYYQTFSSNSINIDGTNVLKDEFANQLNKSFSIKMQYRIYYENSTITFNFTNIYLKIRLFNILGGVSNQTYFYNYTLYNSSDDILYSQQFESLNFVPNLQFLHIQFKNNWLSLSFYLDHYIISDQIIINHNFVNFNCEDLLLQYSNIKRLDNEEMIQYTNNSYMYFNNESMAIPNEIEIISSFQIHYSSINIPKTIFPESLSYLYDEILYLQYSKITDMSITFNRSSEYSVLYIKSELSKQIEVFDFDELDKTIDYPYLDEQENGTISLQIESTQNITLNVNINYNIYVLYLDVKSGNLLTSLISDIMIPIILLATFIYAFSQSEHKILSVFGLFFALIVLYLLEYLSLLFLILSMLFAIVVMYFIIKKNKDEILYDK